MTSRVELPSGSERTRATSSAATTMTVHYDALSRSYSLTTPDGGATFRSIDLEPPGPGINSYERDIGDVSHNLLLLAPEHESNLGVRYVGAGYWQRGQAVAGGGLELKFDAFTYGIDTPAAAVPRAGSAGYAVNMLGFSSMPGNTPRVLAGEGDFTVEFASGHFSATGIAFESDVLADFESGPHYWVAAGTLRAGANGFDGDFSYEGRDDEMMNGPINGRFYGPDAQEVGAVFRASNSDGGFAVGTLTGVVDQYTLTPPLTVLPGQDSRGYNASVSFAGVIENADGKMEPGNNPARFDRAGGLIFEGTEIFVDPFPMNDSIPVPTFTADDRSAELSNDRYTVHRRSQGGTDYQLTLSVPGAGNPEIQLTYTSFGMWQRSAQQPQGLETQQYWLTYGVPTHDGVLGRTGTASYTMQIHGSGYSIEQAAEYTLGGTGSMRIDLASLQYQGRLAPTGSEVGGTRTLSFAPLTYSGQMYGNSYSFGSDLHSRPDGQDGWIEGKLYGPRGNEIGAAFDFKTKDANGVATGSFAGAAVGKRD